MFFARLFCVLLLAACSPETQYNLPEYVPEADESVPTPGPTDPADSGNPDEPSTNDNGDISLSDPANKSFEFPAFDDGFTGAPEAWEIDETGDARSYVLSDISAAADGAQFLVMDIDGDGRTWVTSPVLAHLDGSSTRNLSFALRSDCDGVVVVLYAEHQSLGLAVLPTSSTWNDVSFGIPAAEGALNIQVINESSQPCTFEMDDVQVR